MNRRGDNLAPPPRRLPWALSLRVLLGSGWTQFGCLFFCFGMIFVLVFGANADFDDITRFKGSLKRAPGVVTGSEETSMEVNDEDVVGWSYTYAVDGQSLEGFCYTTGWEHEEGKSVQIEFPPGEPTCSRIVGSRKSESPLTVILFVGVFPLVGLCFIVSGIRQGVKGHGLLVSGQLSWGRLQSKNATNVTVNDQPVYELVFAFAPDGYSREFLCRARTHVTERLEDEAEEPLLYAATAPDHSVMLDSLPGGGTIGANGQFLAPGKTVTLLMLLGPAVGLLMSLACLRMLLD